MNIKLKNLIKNIITETFLNEKLILKKYTPKNLLVVISDKGDYKERSAETYKAKDELNKAGFKWTKLYDKDGKEIAAWTIDASKKEEAISIINKLNKEVDNTPNNEFEELVFDLATVSKKTGLDQKIVSFLEQLSQEVDQVYASQEFQKYLNFRKKFRNYSFSNTMLIWIQKPEATRVAGFKKWESLNRRIKKGAKAISIFVPKIKTVKELDLDKEVENKRITGFMVGNVFDISDTEVIPGKEDLVKQTPQWHETNSPNEKADSVSKYLEEIIKDLEIKYGISSGDAQGYASGGTHISINSSVAGVNKVGTLAHELAHVLLHFPNSLFSSEDIKNIPSSIKEYQAEAVAATVLNEYELPYKHSATYIAMWNKDVKQLKQYTDIISKTASYIIDEIDKRAEMDKKQIDEIESSHAMSQFDTRFQKQNLLTSAELTELNKRYDKLKQLANNFKQAAVMLLSFDRLIYFNPSKGANVPIEFRESNGEVVWAVIRDGRITTIFARRLNQGFDYWEDITRGNVSKENIWYMTDNLTLKKLKYSPNERTGDVIKRKLDFAHDYNKVPSQVNEQEGGATMNLQDIDKHNKKLKRLKKVLARQGNKMITYPDLKKTVVGVPWKQLLKK